MRFQDRRLTRADGIGSSGVRRSQLALVPRQPVIVREGRKFNGDMNRAKISVFHY
jgi:hypothetical protein